MVLDHCEISKNNEFVITASGEGPPQVWDLKSGDLHSVQMDGSDLSTVSAHLACRDQILVGHVIDEKSSKEEENGVYVLQLWHFKTGKKIKILEDIKSSASCFGDQDKNDLILARRHTKGDSILVWDLIGNENKDEIFYNADNSDPLITFLRLSNNERFLLAGFDNGENQDCSYLIFDFHSDNVSKCMKGIAVDAEVDATELINDIEAITGTRKGHLFIWNIQTCEVIRQFQRSTIIKDGGLPAHDDLINSVNLSKDGKYIISCGRDKTIKVWKTEGGKLLHSLEGHISEVTSGVISVESELIISSSLDGTIRVWRLLDGNQMCCFSSNIAILHIKLTHDEKAIIGLGLRDGNYKMVMLQLMRHKIKSCKI